MKDTIFREVPILFMNYDCYKKKNCAMTGFIFGRLAPLAGSPRPKEPQVNFQCPLVGLMTMPFRWSTM